MDHLLRFPSRNAAGIALSAHGLAKQIKGNWQFDTSKVCFNVGGPNDESLRVGTQRAVWDISDPENPVLTTPEVLLPGWFCIAALPRNMSNIRKLSGKACRFVADRVLSKRNKRNEILYEADNLGSNFFTNTWVEPVFAGSRYKFKT